MKIKFFTNVSHEFRTPLSLIISPLEKLMKTARQEEELRHFHLIHCAWLILIKRQAINKVRVIPALH
ncbi:MAG: histidine kinase dimerization/phospho-acceptor domain-containing protein [Cyclobacteriaceae bacterium]